MMGICVVWTFYERRVMPKRLMILLLGFCVMGFGNRVMGAGHTDKAYAAHVVKLKKRLPGKGFTIVISKPFVIIGDEPARMVKLRAERTVKWAVDRLKKAYFKKDPDEILDVWLFKDKKSYERNALKLFGRKPTTPYGYYSSVDRALVMNISTGGGTLVHEIVHPYVAANFPNCPSWFNEGLGSLYEQCGDKKGEIWGYTNWRLRGLKRAITKGGLTKIKKLAGMDSGTFYGDARGTNYAQSRYLLYYLQEKGLLRKYYKRFVANQKKDKTGYETLKEILGEKDMDAFQKRWEAWVLTLKLGR